jgi:hypothetical protein
LLEYPEDVGIDYFYDLSRTTGDYSGKLGKTTGDALNCQGGKKGYGQTVTGSVTLKITGHAADEAADKFTGTMHIEFKPTKGSACPAGAITYELKGTAES